MTDVQRDELFGQAEEARVNGNYEAAQPLYESILAEYPSHPGSKTGLGHCLLNTGLFDEALEAYKEVVALTPDDVKALLTYGKALCMLGMFDEAKEQFEKVLGIDPGNEDAMEQMVYFPDD